LSEERYPLLLLFANELPAGCYRIFRRGAVCVSVWCDGDVVKCCARDAYTFSTTPLPLPTASLLGANLGESQRYPSCFIPILEHAKGTDLQQLAHSLAVLVGGTKSELAHRIVACLSH